MRSSSTCLALVLVGSALAAQEAETTVDPLPSPDPAVTKAELEHHVRFLASDELRGREAATPDAARAAHYLARSMERAGLKPAGDDGTFLQAIPVARYEYEAPPRLIFTTTAGETVEAAQGTHFALLIRGEGRSTGELAIRLVDGDNRLPEKADRKEALFIHMTRNERRAWLDEYDQGDGSGWGLDLVRSQEPDAEENGEADAEPPRARIVVGPGGEDPCERVYLRGDVWKRLVAGDFSSVRLEIEERRTGLEDYNVVGLLPGEDAKRADEAVVLLAEYDQLGLQHKRSAEGGRIAHGADDNASGCAAVLEIAQALASEGGNARPVVFLLTTGSQKGRYGLRHYFDQPAVPIAGTVVALGLRRLGHPGPEPGTPWLTGFERTNLASAFEEKGISVAEDPHRRDRLFRRSAAYAFAQAGVIGQTLSSSDPGKSDPLADPADSLDYAHLEACARSAHACARLLADGSFAPEWKPDGKPEAPKKD